MEHRVADLYIGEDYEARAEMYNGMIFIHCTLHKHDKTTLKAIRKLVQDGIAEARTYGYEGPVYSYTRDGRLSRLAGGTYLTSFESEGVFYDIYMWG